MPYVGIVSPCYNEKKNVEETYRQAKDLFTGLLYTKYSFFLSSGGEHESSYNVRRAGNTSQGRN